MSTMSNKTRHAAVRRELAGLMARVFRALSFEPGQAPAYDDLYAMFIERALLIKTSGAAPEVMDIRDFVEPRRARVRSGQTARFREVELFETTEVFGNVAQRFSAYEKSGLSNGRPFAARGVISTQFVRTPAGWRISAMAWDDERPGLSISERYEPTEFGSV